MSRSRILAWGAASLLLVDLILVDGMADLGPLSILAFLLLLLSAFGPARRAPNIAMLKMPTLDKRIHADGMPSDAADALRRRMIEAHRNRYRRPAPELVLEHG
ncbi:hypothetical protein [Oceanomicrobium pacificus]|uniref:Uncharacterized protein n=1 Tax=Oceanomicrobium pacificus TaxID=2692916 RepID=A0A6B0TZ37_9RHOB|nr:hypothetical protein [Oceanomicrobium pacificus]MXU66532.1 hypothetical protein [Oceanomicrobium pacificus]